MKKRLVSLCLIIALAVAMCVPAYATMRAASISPSLSFSGTTANCRVNIMDAGKNINATMSLWDGDALVDSWSGNGSTLVSITGSCNVVSGRTYTLTVEGTIGNVPFAATPVSRRCP